MRRCRHQVNQGSAGMDAKSPEAGGAGEVLVRGMSEFHGHIRGHQCSGEAGTRLVVVDLVFNFIALTPDASHLLGQRAPRWDSKHWRRGNEVVAMVLPGLCEWICRGAVEWAAAKCVQSQGWPAHDLGRSFVMEEEAVCTRACWCGHGWSGALVVSGSRIPAHQVGELCATRRREQLGLAPGCIDLGTPQCPTPLVVSLHHVQL